MEQPRGFDASALDDKVAKGSKLAGTGKPTGAHPVVRQLTLPPIFKLGGVRAEVDF